MITITALKLAAIKHSPRMVMVVRDEVAAARRCQRQCCSWLHGVAMAHRVVYQPAVNHRKQSFVHSGFLAVLIWYPSLN
jgi:hypothetical protein